MNETDHTTRAPCPLQAPVPGLHAAALAFVACGLGLAGCSAGPETTRPAAATRPAAETRPATAPAAEIGWHEPKKQPADKPRSASNPRSASHEPVEVSRALARTHWPRIRTGPAPGGNAPFGPLYFHSYPVRPPVTPVRLSRQSPEARIETALASGDASRYMGSDVVSAAMRPMLYFADWELLLPRVLALQPPWAFPAAAAR